MRELFKEGARLTAEIALGSVVLIGGFMGSRSAIPEFPADIYSDCKDSISFPVYTITRNPRMIDVGDLTLETPDGYIFYPDNSFPLSKRVDLTTKTSGDMARLARPNHPLALVLYRGEVSARSSEDQKIQRAITSKNISKCSSR